jgi:Family of unknown function (DUF6055)
VRGRWGLIGGSLLSLTLLGAAPASTRAADQWAFRAPAARPTDRPDPSRNAYTVPEALRSPACTAHFCVHWVDEGIDAPKLTDADGNGLPDFVQRVASVAEHVYAVENGQLGWRKPKCDGRRGGLTCRTDVYLDEIGGAFFGYAELDDGQATPRHRLPRRMHGYLVLDNDYAASEFPGTTQEHDLEVTFAHEYAHILQFGYDAYQEAWFAESTAVWMEDQVYNRINGYLRYVRRWVSRYDTPLTASSIKGYGSAVWNKWLARRYGSAIVRSAWARAIHTRPGGFSIAAYDSAIRAAGHSDFNRDFARFADDLPEWRTDSVFPEGDLYPNVVRQGSVPLDGRARLRRLDHTTFQLLRVHARGGRAVALAVVAPRGIDAGAALVGRIGSERHGRVVSVRRFRRHGGRMVVRLVHPGRFSRITAVLSNDDTAASGFDARLRTWAYRADRAPFRVSARLAR